MCSDEDGLEAVCTAVGGVVGGNEVAGVMLFGAAEASDKRDLAISCS